MQAEMGDVGVRSFHRLGRQMRGKSTTCRDAQSQAPRVFDPKHSWVRDPKTNFRGGFGKSETCRASFGRSPGSARSVWLSLISLLRMYT